MRNCEQLWRTGVLIAMTFASQAFPAEPGASGKASALRVTIKQEILCEDVKAEIFLKAVFGSRRRYRFRGYVRAPEWTGDEKLRAPLTIVNDGKTLRQLMEVEDFARLIYCDLAVIRKEFPDARFCRDLDPREYAAVLRAARSKRSAGKEYLGAEGTTMWDVKLEKDYPIAAVMGCDENEIPPPKRLRIWIANKDGLPRKVVAFDKATGGRKIMTMTFSEVKFVKDPPAGEFVLKTPEGVRPRDYTQQFLKGLKPPVKAEDDW